MSVLFIHSARQLLTLRGSPEPRRGPASNQLQIINDGALLIRDGVIEDVGPTRRIENLPDARTAREISAAGRVVMPGFVDSHTHLISGRPILPPEGCVPDFDTHNDARSILANVPAVRESSSRRLAAEAAQALRQCVAHGTTTIESKSGFGLTASAELKILRVLTSLGDAPITVVPTFSAASVAPPELNGRGADYITWLARELLPLVHRRGLARFVDGSCDRGSFTAQELAPLYEAAQHLGLPLKMNLAHFGPAEGAALASRYSFTSFDHLNHIDETAVGQIAASGSVATLMPADAFFLADDAAAPARRLIDAGVPVALASGYSRVTGPTHSMQAVIFVACRRLRITAAEAVTAATINGAHALKLGHRAGSLERHKQADIAILKVGDYRELACEFGMNLVDVTIKQGRLVSDSSGVKWPARS